MLETLKYITSDFWVFIAGLIIVCCVLNFFSYLWEDVVLATYKVWLKHKQIIHKQNLKYGQKLHHETTKQDGYQESSGC